MDIPLDMARRLQANSLEGYEVFRSMTEDPEIDCEPQGEGNLLIAHSHDAYRYLKGEARLCNDLFGYGIRMLSREEVHNDFVGDQEAWGAMLEPVGISVQPLKRPSTGNEVSFKPPILGYQPQLA